MPEEKRVSEAKEPLTPSPPVLGSAVLQKLQGSRDKEPREHQTAMPEELWGCPWSGRAIATRQVGPQVSQNVGLSLITQR